jgi:hypothetical protein
MIQKVDLLSTKCRVSGKVILNAIKEIRSYTVTWLCEISEPWQASRVGYWLYYWIPMQYGTPYNIIQPRTDGTFVRDIDTSCRLRDTDIAPFDTETGDSDRWLITQTYDNETIAFTEKPPWEMFPEITGTFVKDSREASVDIYGDLLQMSNLELMEGEPVTRDYSRVQITFNWATLFYDGPLWAGAMDCVNSRPMWGFAPYQVKLSEHGFGIETWESEVSAGWGESRFVKVSYWKLSATFEFKYLPETQQWEPGIEDSWLRVIPDYGNRILIEDGKQDNPAHYKPFKDASGNESGTFLNGKGEAATKPSDIWFWEKELYVPIDFSFTRLPKAIILPEYDEYGNVIWGPGMIGPH